MKKLILSGCLVASLMFVSSNINAQTYAEVQKPGDGTSPWSIGMVEYIYGAAGNGQTGINWSGPALRARYFLNSNLALRLQLGLGDGSGQAMSETHNFYENADGTGGTGIQKIKRSAFNIQLGAEYHMAGTQKLDPYAALGINFGAGKQVETGTEYSNGDIYPVSGYNDLVKNYELAGGYTVFGATLGLGADFYFVENVYIGLELGLGFNAVSYKDGTAHYEYEDLLGSMQVVDGVSAGSKYSFLTTQAAFRLGWRF